MQDAINKMNYDMNNNAGGKLDVTLRLMKCAKFFNYKVIGDESLTDQALFDSDNGLCVFLEMLPLYLDDINNDTNNGLQEIYKAEWKKYRRVAILEKAKGETACDLWSFWRNQKLNLPKMFRLAKEIALIVPSSATVERLFSIFNATYGDRQDSALQDYKSIGVKLRFNENFRQKLHVN